MSIKTATERGTDTATWNWARRSHWGQSSLSPFTPSLKRYEAQISITLTTDHRPQATETRAAEKQAAETRAWGNGGRARRHDRGPCPPHPRPLARQLPRCKKYFLAPTRLRSIAKAPMGDIRRRDLCGSVAYPSMFAAPQFTLHAHARHALLPIPPYHTPSPCPPAHTHSRRVSQRPMSVSAPMSVPASPRRRVSVPESPCLRVSAPGPLCLRAVYQCHVSAPMSNAHGGMGVWAWAPRVNCGAVIIAG